MNEATLKSPLIAIVDDDQVFLGYMSTFLRSRGYSTASYLSGSEFLRSIQNGEAPSLVLLDVLMPGMDGLEVLRRLRTGGLKLPVVFVSGQQHPQTIVDAVRLGAMDYVVKPSDLSGVQEAALEATIARAIERVSLADEVAKLSREPQPATEPYFDGESVMDAVMTMVERVADSDLPVLLRGETGVGKEVVARELHRRSSRRRKPFAKVNCAALPSDLLESELFGHERGAFTGAQKTRIGRFESAEGGTLLLDEVADLPIPVQAKVLHVLQDGEITRVGSNKPIPLRVRVLASTNRDLESMIENKQFREDLYYRLEVVEIEVPPLRERQSEIAPLTDHFLRRYSTEYGRPLLRPSSSLRDAFLAYSWPGNVRQLENAVRRFVVFRDEGAVISQLDRKRPKQRG